MAENHGAKQISFQMRALYKVAEVCYVGTQELNIRIWVFWWVLRIP